MTKTLVLNDDPMMHMALGLVLERVQSEVVHVANTDALLDQLTADVRCVILDLGMKSLDLPKITAALRTKAPKAGVVLMGPKKSDPPPIERLFWTEQPYTDRDAIAEFANTLNRPS